MNFTTQNPCEKPDHQHDRRKNKFYQIYLLHATTLCCNHFNAIATTAFYTFLYDFVKKIQNELTRFIFATAQLVITTGFSKSQLYIVQINPYYGIQDLKTINRIWY